MKKKITLIFLIAMTVFLIIYGILMIKHRIEWAITDAVFVDTEKIHNVGFQKVNGRIIRMTKLEGECVKKGEVLAEIDPRNYEISVRKLEKEIRAKEREREKLRIALLRTAETLDLKEKIARNRVKEIENEILSLKDEIKSLDARIAQLRRDTRRYRNLYKEGAVSKRRYEVIETELIAEEKKRDSLIKKLHALEERLLSAKKEVLLIRAEKRRVDEIKREIEAISSEIESLKERLKNARLCLSYCTLRSPVDGRIAKKYVSVGDVISPGTPVYAIIDPKDIYILVLLEETKLKGVEPGCPAKIKIDAYPDEEYRGVVKEILPASAAKFALVPRDISAGEFTKVVQRMQVKVKITEGDISKLVVGMGGEIEIKRRR